MKQKKETGGFEQFSFDYRGKKIRLPVIECSSIFSQMHGLMFSRRNNALLFTFRQRNRASIHSFFCPDFIVIYFDGNKIVDVKSITNWHFFIRSKAAFTHFLEIPVGNPVYLAILDGVRKI